MIKNKIKWSLDLLCCWASLACVADPTKCLFLNDEPCMVRPTITDINPNELKY